MVKVLQSRYLCLADNGLVKSAYGQLVSGTQSLAAVKRACSHKTSSSIGLRISMEREGVCKWWEVSGKLEGGMSANMFRRTRNLRSCSTEYSPETTVDVDAMD